MSSSSPTKLLLPRALAKMRTPWLAKLPKTPLPRGVTFKGQTPGNVLPLIVPHLTKGPFLDPSHPAVQAVTSSTTTPSRGGGGGKSGLKRNPTVMYTSPSASFRLVAGPKALLAPPERHLEPAWSAGLMYTPWSACSPTPPPREDDGKGKGKEEGEDKGKGKGEEESGREREVDLLETTEAKTYTHRRRALLSKSTPVSLQFAHNKAGMGGKACYASAAKKRVRAAVMLVVHYGAKVVDDADGSVDDDGSVFASAGEESIGGGKEGVVGKKKRRRSKEDGNGGKKIVLDLDEVKSMHEAGESWILRDWTYVVHQTPALLRMPYTALIPEVRTALAEVRSKARALERRGFGVGTGGGSGGGGGQGKGQRQRMAGGARTGHSEKKEKRTVGGGGNKTSSR